ncbi:DUF7503 family protein [Halorussus salilacus]
MENKSKLADWLADNPKMMGVLWAMMLLLAESGSVIATSSSARAGP